MPRKSKPCKGSGEVPQADCTVIRPDKDRDPIWSKAYIGVHDPMSLDIIANR